MNYHHFFITGRKEPAADNQCLVEFGKQYCYTNYEYDNIAINYEYEERKNFYHDDDMKKLVVVDNNFDDDDDDVK